MTTTATPNTAELVERGTQGDSAAIDDLFGRHQKRIHRMIRRRLDRRLRGRVDASDVLQDVYLEAARRLPEYLGRPNAPFVLWLQSLARRKIADVHRRHVQAQARDVRREATPASSQQRVPEGGGLSHPSLQRPAKTPGEAAVNAEVKSLLEEMIASMEPADRDILVLRHFDGLSGAEAAQRLGISHAAARQRHTRALRKLKGLVERRPGVVGETWLERQRR